MNTILLSDSYKVTHWRQYPKGTTNVYSYFESRGGQFKTTTFFGLQYIMERYLTRRITADDIWEAGDLFEQHFGSDLFNAKGWHHIVDKHDGRLPELG